MRPGGVPRHSRICALVIELNYLYTAVDIITIVFTGCILVYVFERKVHGCLTSKDCVDVQMLRGVV